MCAWLVKGQMGKQGQGTAGRTQPCAFFKTPKMFAEEGLQSPPQDILEGCLFTAPELLTAVPAPDVVQQGAVQGPARPPTWPWAALGKMTSSRERATGIASFWIPGCRCQWGYLLRCALLFTETGTHLPLVTKQLSGSSSLCQLLPRAVLDSAEMNGPRSRSLKPWLLLRLIRLS